MSSDNEYVSNFFRSGQTSHLSAAVIVDVSKIDLYETIVARQIERCVVGSVGFLTMEIDV